MIDATATVTDVDSADFDTGTLTVNVSVNGTANDDLTILPGGNVTLNGADVEVSATVVGTFAGGTGGTNLVITWNAKSTPANAQEVMRQIAYSNSSDNPDTSTRTIDFLLTDGAGGTSNTAQQTVNITALNDDPALTTPGAAVAYT